MHDLVLRQAHAIENLYPGFPQNIQEPEGALSSDMTSTVNEEKAGDVVNKSCSPQPPSQIEVVSSKHPALATNTMMTRQILEGIFDPCCSNSDDDPERFGGHATIRAPIGEGTCSRSCPCQCHLRKNIESPRWSINLLGNLFYSYTGTLQLQPRSCNHLGCQQKRTVSCQLTYHFPQWFIKKSFALTAHLRLLSGLSGSWSIGFPRTISASHNAWKCIEQANMRNSYKC